MRFAEVVRSWPLSDQQLAVHHLQPISDVDPLRARPDASDALITLTANRLSPPGAINHHTQYSADTKRTSGTLRLCCSSACLFVVSCGLCPPSSSPPPDACWADRDHCRTPCTLPGCLFSLIISPSGGKFNNQ